tara:strand:+ start:27600 stop:27704 length:105 start_codon:yes stop_codon:yes gene_type:complete
MGVYFIKKISIKVNKKKEIELNIIDAYYFKILSK